jgi:hypothetical protein
MINTTTWTNAPAGFLGLGGSDARAYAVQGTAVPFGCSTVDGMTSAPRLRTGDRQDFLQGDVRFVEGPRVQGPAVSRLVVEVHVQKSIAPTTGTTLGIPSSRRPPS